VLERLLEAEIQCKSTGLPDEAIARRTCLGLAKAEADRKLRQRR
jgi:hypothetical protein